MKRKLIAIAIASLGLATTGAFARGDLTYQQQGDSGASSASPSAQGAEQSTQPGAQSPEQSAQDSEVVRQVQTALTYEGYDPGPIDGQLSSQTQDALKEAQRDKGLSETGRIDSQTLAALGMGDLGPTSGSSSSSDSLSSAWPESGDSESDGGRNGSLPS